MITIEILSDSRYPLDRKAIRNRIIAVLEKKGIKENITVSVSVVGDRKIHALNKKYRHKDYPTDVLSFPTVDPTQPMDEGGFFHPTEIGLVLGDIVLSYPQVVLQASKTNQLVDQVAGDLIEHGLLHLLGIHHD